MGKELIQCKGGRKLGGKKYPEVGISAGENNLAWSKGRVLQRTELTIPLTPELMSSPLQWFSFAVIKANPSGLGKHGAVSTRGQC